MPLFGYTLSFPRQTTPCWHSKESGPGGNGGSHLTVQSPGCHPKEMLSWSPTPCPSSLPLLGSQTKVVCQIQHPFFFLRSNGSTGCRVLQLNLCIHLLYTECIHSENEFILHAVVTTWKRWTLSFFCGWEDSDAGRAMQCCRVHSWR